MDQELKQRLIGASVIIALAIIFVPMLFDGDGVKQQNQNISIEIPETPNDLEVKTFEIDKPVTDQQLEIVPAGDVGLVNNNTADPEDSPIFEPHLVVKDEAPQSVAEASPIDSNENSGSDQDSSVDLLTISQKEAGAKPSVAQSEPLPEAEAKPVEESTPQVATPNKPVAQAPVTSVDLAYRVKLGSFSKQANAQKVKSQLLQKNIKSIVEKDDTRPLFHVWSADMYQSKAKAEVYVKAVNALKLNIGTPSVQSMDAIQVDAVAQKGQLGWVVQLGSFSAKNNAIELRNKVKAAGFTGFVDRVKNSKGENRFRLRVGPLMEKKDAENAQININNRLKINGLIKTHEPGLPVES